jgi:O-antigen ligase
VARKKRQLNMAAVPFWALVVFLILTFLTGGGSRADIQSLVILRPAAVIFCGIGLWSLKKEHILAYRFLFGMAAAIFVLVVIHLVPLPPAVWGALPGREVITKIDKVAGLGPVWRPISMVPSATWNAFYSLFVPFAVLLLGVQLSREERFMLLPVLLGLGLLSGCWGLLQAIGSPDGPLYLYETTNNGSAVGLFSNRNHQAILLAMLFPMLPVYASAGVRTEEQRKVRGYAALAAGVVLVPLLLVTGSRAGLIVGVFGLLCAPFLYHKPNIVVPKKRKGQTINLRWLVGGFAVLCLGALTVIMSRAKAVQRLSAPDHTEELRFQMWGPIAQMGEKYFPFGSGVGSFVETYQIDEPHRLLQLTYVNHAHNDWLEVFLTAGLPGLVLVAIAIFGFGRALVSIFRTPLGVGRDVAFVRLGAVLLIVIALGSIGDYPLRTPSLACVFVFAAIWLGSRSTDSTKRAGSP